MVFRQRMAAWLATLVLLLVVPLLAFALYSTYHYAHERQVAIEQDLRRQAEILAHQVASRLDKTLGLISSLAVSDPALNGDVPALYRLAQQVRDSNPELAAISLIDDREQLLFLTLQPLGTTLPAARLPDVRQVFATGRPVLSGLFKSPIRDRQMVALGMPVFRNGQVVYCLRAVLGADTLNDLLRSPLTPKGWIASLVDGEGVILARSHAADKFVGQSGSAPLLAALKNRTTDLWIGVTKEGIETKTVLRQLTDWHWYLVLGVPTQQLNAPMQQELVRLAVIAVIVLGASLFGVVSVSRRITRELRETADASRAVLRGEAVPPHVTSITELDELRAGLTQVDELSRIMEARVAQRTAELAAAKARIIHFAAQQEERIEAERLRIAREVHDQIGAVLTGVMMMVRSLPSGALPATQARDLIMALDSGLSTARRIASELRPPLLDDLGLGTAIEEMMAATLNPAGVACHVDLQGTEQLGESQTIACFRIVQEGVTNVARHAHARNCRVHGRMTDAGCYLLTIKDDGVGMPASGMPRGHLGVIGMQERAHLLHGELTIENHPGQGLALYLVFPLDPARVSHA